MGREQVMTARAIGFGCSSDAALADVLELLHAMIGDARCITTLATLDRRAAMARAVATKLGLDVALFSAETLRTIAGVRTMSARASASVGTPSVAEAAALAALGPGAQLVVERRTGHRCTCALAELR